MYIHVLNIKYSDRMKNNPLAFFVKRNKKISYSKIRGKKSTYSIR